MASNGFATLFARLRPPDGDAVTDAELLRRYAEARDPAAFELLVWRHGPLVLGTCRRVARHEADAEDAFQATFLVLARKAGGVRRSLPGWLHRTARRAALRAVSRRRVATLTADVPATPRLGPDADELELLDAAIDGLGERHRRVVVLCYLQGHTADAAATILGVPRGTVLSRLATARARLAKTLTRRGVTLPAALMTATVSFDRVAACVELTLNPRVAAPAAAIAHGVLTMMLRHQLAVTAVALTLVGVGVTGTGVALMPQAGSNGPPVPAVVAATKKADLAADIKDAEAVRIMKLAQTLDILDSEIYRHQEYLIAEERKSPPMSDLILKAKAALLIQVELQLIQTEVTVHEVETKLSKAARQSNPDTKSESEKLAPDLAGHVKASKMYAAKRDVLTREIADGTARQVLSPVSDKLRRFKAARDIVESQLLQASYGDAKPSATSDAKLDRVLHELVELRCEVKELRDGK